MPSKSLIKWNAERREALDEVEDAHVTIGGTERGRRYATQQINYAYAALLSSHFQGFCRDLHSECVEHMVSGLPPQLGRVMHADLLWNRSLSKGNPHPGAIGADFARLGVGLWTAVYALDARNERRRQLLEELIEWRNAIAHQDFGFLPTGVRASLHLGRVRAWRRAVGALARYFDEILETYLQSTTGASPW